jgi:CheY-like chemotaxis protein
LLQLLTDAGFVVHVAHDGEQALSLYLRLREQGVSPDVLLSDVRMPRMTGIDLAARLRELDPALPVLFISGYLEESLDGPNFQRNSDLLLKPFTAETLLAQLDRKVNGAAHERASNEALAR